jgi:1-deoxy-D-xylulose-5-phosphate synthase
MTTELLESITGPDDLDTLDLGQLEAIAAQIRRQLIETVTGTGGHLGAGLGVVELTVALHHVFSSPTDILLFDTGHQCYPHKMLTGRAAAFGALRKSGGLAGYPNRAESVHDWVENSHASISLAWADGVAKALELRGERHRRVVAVIGDGALTGGVAWEGLNNIGGAQRPVIVVLNDNERSYDLTAGAVATHLRKLRTDPSAHENLFTALGFKYLGPVDGHDIDALCTALHEAVEMHRPVVVHALTRKGHGYPPAENDENDRMHACGVIDPATGRPAQPSKPTWTDMFEHELAELAHKRTDVVAATAAMRLPTGLGTMSADLPDRVFDSGIAEQHLLASAAGMASAGLHPVVALYSTFLHRAFDQLLLDIGLHHLPVTIVLDRAGITGPDGPSHHGMWDLVLLGCVPDLRVACPRDPAQLRELLHEAVDTAGPTALHYPKAPAGPEIPSQARMNGMDILYRSGGLPLDVLIVGVGAMAESCIRAAVELTESGIGATVVDPRWVFPINAALVALAARHRLTLCVEDGVAEGGIGSRLVSAAGSFEDPVVVRILGLPTRFIAHGSRSQILDRHGLSGPGIAATCRSHLSRLPEQSAPAIDSWCPS